MADFASILESLSWNALKPVSDRPGEIKRGDGPGVDAYPNSVWAAKASEYEEYIDHFEGDWLDETVSVDEERTVDRYPLKFNVYRLPVMLHASFLFGEVPDSSDPLVEPVVEVYGNTITDDSVDQNVRKPSQRSIDAGRRMSEYLNEVWYQNEGRSKQLEGGVISQVYGGCIFGVSFDPSKPSYDHPVRIDNLLPEYFFPVWAPNDRFNLVEAFVKYFITSIQAKALYNVDMKGDRGLFIEHWKRDHYEISINGNIVKWNGLNLEGPPLGGFVPYTYIPHPPRFGSFYGESLLKSKINLSKEINARMSDLGDIVAEEARQIPAVANTNRLSVKRVSGQVYVLDMASSVPGSAEPRIYYPNRSAASSAASINYVLDLINTARSEAYTPPIVYGLDEGSQRSALTLALRMMPLVAHIRDERTYWGAGLTQVNRQLLQIAVEKNINGITEDMTRRCRIHHQWSPMLPRDAEQELNQLLLRLQSNTISPESAMQIMGDIPDIQGERKLILQWMEDLAEAQGSGFGFGNQDGPKGGSMGESSGLSKPKQPQASTTKEE